jgi:hypothetical protein
MRTPGDRPESSLGEALRANASPRCLGGSGVRGGPVGDQEPRGRPSAERGLLPYGFARFEAAPTGADGEIEDVQLAVRGAPISRDADWLLAIEQFGEGIFIHFDEEAIAQWVQKPGAVQRNAKLLAGYGHWQKRFAGKAPSYPGTPYVLLYSISHALTAEIALECGYPASSSKETVYALSGPRGGGDFDRCGVLI